MFPAASVAIAPPSMKTLGSVPCRPSTQSAVPSGRNLLTPGTVMDPAARLIVVDQATKTLPAESVATGPAVSGVLNGGNAVDLQSCVPLASNFVTAIGLYVTRTMLPAASVVTERECVPSGASASCLDTAGVPRLL